MVLGGLGGCPVISGTTPPHHCLRDDPVLGRDLALVAADEPEL
jgi:hypothetical protein